MDIPEDFEIDEEGVHYYAEVSMSVDDNDEGQELSEEEAPLQIYDEVPSHHGIRYSSTIPRNEQQSNGDITAEEIDIDGNLADSDETIVNRSDESTGELNTSNEYCIDQLNVQDPDDSSDPDPFDIDYIDIYERIFSYLDIKDILNLSETSKSFYKLTGITSKGPMSRIKLIINEKKDHLIQEHLKSPSRKYQHIEIRGLYDSNYYMGMFLRQNAHSLVSIRTYYDIIVPSTLPMVQEIYYLSMDCGQSRIKFEENGLIPAAYKVKRLHICVVAENPSFLAEFIQQSEHLEKLVFEQNSSLKCMEELEQFPNYKFKLHTLHVELNENRCDFNDFIGFLLKQRNHLRDVKFGGDAHELGKVMKMLPNLERITFASHHNYSWMMPTCESLKEANLILVGLDLIRKFLESNPDIERLYVSHLNKDILKHIILLGRGIKVLRFAVLYDDCSLDELKTFYKIMCKNSEIMREAMEIIQI